MNKTDLPIKRVFTAINGKELADMILFDLKQKLLVEIEVAESESLALVEYGVTLNMRAYPWRTEKWVEKKFSGTFQDVSPSAVVDTILEDFEKNLRQDMDLEEAVTFPLVEYDAILTVLADTIDVTVQVHEIIDKDNPPDRARENRDMPVMIPGKSKAGTKYYTDQPARRKPVDRHKVEDGD